MDCPSNVWEVLISIEELMQQKKFDIAHAALKTFIDCVEELETIVENSMEVIGNDIGKHYASQEPQEPQNKPT